MFPIEANRDEYSNKYNCVYSLLISHKFGCGKSWKHLSRIATTDG